MVTSKLALVMAATTTLMLGSIAAAETVATVNGVAIDSTLLNMYLESRIQKPAVQASPEERSAVTQELTDIFLLTTQPNAKELENDPLVKAQIELQSRAALAQAVATNPTS